MTGTVDDLEGGVGQVVGQPSAERRRRGPVERAVPEADGAAHGAEVDVRRRDLQRDVVGQAVEAADDGVNDALGHRLERARDGVELGPTGGVGTLAHVLDRQLEVARPGGEHRRQQCPDLGRRHLGDHLHDGVAVGGGDVEDAVVAVGLERREAGDDAHA